MLKEDTGTPFLDSGGTQQPDGTFLHGYGRHWQRNQGRDFEQERWAGVHFRYGEVNFTYSIYHWLKERLVFNEELDANFHAFCELRENQHHVPSGGFRQQPVTWLECMRRYMPHLAESRPEDPPQGIYGDGEPMLIYTYNHENLLSQDIQFMYWEDDDGGHVLLQVHGGCDARGGLTKPRAFDITLCDAVSFLDYADARIGCSHDWNHHWYSESGYYWTGDDVFDLSGYGRDDEDVPIVNIEELLEGEHGWAKFAGDHPLKSSAEALFGIYRERAVPPEGACRDGQAFMAAFLGLVEVLLVIQPKTIYTTAEGMGACPVCGKGILTP